MRTSVRAFISYSFKDQAFRETLEVHLSPLKRMGLIEAWHDGKLTPGGAWETEIMTEFEQAELINLLVSPDYLASDYCWDIEMRRALERHEEGSAIVVPVLIRHAFWQIAPFSKLSIVPHKARPITSYKNQDRAWLYVVRTIHELIQARRRDVISKSG
jgi:internalin A